MASKKVQVELDKVQHVLHNGEVEELSSVLHQEVINSKLNRKVRRLALKSALSSKVQDNEFTAIDGISFEAPKTKQMVKVLENLNAPVKTLIVVDEITLNVEKSASNIPGVKLLDA